MLLRCAILFSLTFSLIAHASSACFDAAKGDAFGDFKFQTLTHSGPQKWTLTRHFDLQSQSHTATIQLVGPKRSRLTIVDENNKIVDIEIPEILVYEIAEGGTLALVGLEHVFLVNLLEGRVTGVYEFNEDSRSWHKDSGVEWQNVRINNASTSTSLTIKSVSYFTDDMHMTFSTRAGVRELNLTRISSQLGIP